MTRFNATAISALTAYELSRAIATIRYFKGVEKAVLRALVDHYPRVWQASRASLGNQDGHLRPFGPR